MKVLKPLVACSFALVLSCGLAACASGASSAGDSSSAASSAAASSAAESSAAESSAAASSEEPASSGASQSGGASSAENESASASAASSSATTIGEASESEASASAQEAGFDFVSECTDEHGNISLYALTELKGWQVETLLDQQGYEWNESEMAWIRPMDGAQFSAYKETGTYTQETYNEMNEKGGAIAAVGFNIVAGFKDPQAALSGNAQCVIEASYFDGDEGIAIFYGPSMKEYLAIVGPYSESTTQIMIFSQEAVGSGMADEMLGTPVGGTLRDVWKTVTGKDSYN